MKRIYNISSYCIKDGKTSEVLFYDNSEVDPKKPILIKGCIKHSETKQYDNTFFVDNSYATETETRNYIHEEIESEDFFWDFETLIYVLDYFLRESNFYSSSGDYCTQITILFSTKFRIVFRKNNFSAFIECLENVLEKYKSNGICLIDKGVNNHHIYFYADFKRVIS